ncbi:MAG: aldehyde dehydrogenase family protein, partial [Acidobacteriaceae bacterium]|nr:aldehyde dehydrogenase family protein [Acidobacteriaceae bacterium]
MSAVEERIRLRRVSHWIGGKPVESQSGRSGTVWNPATGQPQASVDFASEDEVDGAVAAAKAAFPEWRATPLSRRSEILFRFRELIDTNRNEIARFLTSEHGKI